MHADEIITFDLTFKREFSIGQLPFVNSTKGLIFDLTKILLPKRLVLKAWRNWPTLLAKHYCLFLCH